jgi:hypothetical protein
MKPVEAFIKKHRRSARRKEPERRDVGKNTCSQ